MNRKTQILLATHLAALGLAFGLAWNIPPGLGVSGNAKPLKTKSGSRDAPGSTGDGERLLARFTSRKVEKPTDKDSKYLALKASLPVAADVKAAAMEVIGRLDQGRHRDMTEQENWEHLAEAEVRTLHWMRIDPVGAMDFLTTNEVSFRHSLTMDFNEHVFKEIVGEHGLLASVAWLSKTVRTTPTFCEAAVAGMKSGGGVALLGKLVSSMESYPTQAAYLKEVSNPRNMFGRQNYGFFLQAGEAVRFEERERLLQMAKGQPTEAYQLDLLTGFARSDPAAASWLLESVANGDLQGLVAERVKSEARASIQNAGSVDLEQRVDVLADSPGHAGKSREELATELVGRDVARMLSNGRDWSYEFHHGEVTADEVLAAMRAALPGVSGGGDAALRGALYQRFAEENPEAALPLIAGLPEVQRRRLLYQSAANGFSDVSPEVFSNFLAGLPAPTNPEEVELRQEAAIAKARKFAARFGDEYEAVVKAMPAGNDKIAAAKGLVLETRSANPAAAAELEKQLLHNSP